MRYRRLKTPFIGANNRSYTAMAAARKIFLSQNGDHRNQPPKSSVQFQQYYLIPQNKLTSPLASNRCFKHFWFTNKR